MSQADKFPLHWPQGYLVTQHREESRFKCTFAEARDGIYCELQKLGASDYFISCNINRNKSGQLVAGKLIYDNPGVAVYFKFKGEQKVIACDKWKWIHENLRAVEKSIEAIRGLERWGCTNIISHAVSGLKELAMNAGDSNEAWWMILGVEQDYSESRVEIAYRNLIKKYHPNNRETGDHELFIKVQAAYKEFRAK